MAFELSEIYHTKSMLKILKNQGNLHLALNLAKSMTAQRPDDLALQDIFTDIKAEVQKSFDKFQEAAKQRRQKKL